MKWWSQQREGWDEKSRTFSSWWYERWTKRKPNSSTCRDSKTCLHNIYTQENGESGRTFSFLKHKQLGDIQYMPYPHQKKKKIRFHWNNKYRKYKFWMQDKEPTENLWVGLASWNKTKFTKYEVSNITMLWEREILNSYSTLFSMRRTICKVPRAMSRPNQPHTLSCYLDHQNAETKSSSAHKQYLYTLGVG